MDSGVCHRSSNQRGESQAECELGRLGCGILFSHRGGGGVGVNFSAPFFQSQLLHSEKKPASKNLYPPPPGPGVWESCFPKLPASLVHATPNTKLISKATCNFCACHTQIKAGVASPEANQRSLLHLSCSSWHAAC